VVVKGDQLGRTLGYPTANIGGVDQFKLVPGDGIYAVEVELRSGQHTGMLYIGDRPTVQQPEPKRVVEVHIFDLDRDLYGETITVRFMDRVRGDMRFADLDALKQQLHRDNDMVRERLGQRK
jgi:riboflavin kinase/FMN adenylyltransferase